MKEYPLKVYEGKHPRINVTEDFVAKNNLKLARTDAEMLDYGNTHNSFMNFAKEVLVDYISPVESAIWIKEDCRQKHIETQLKIIDVYEAAQDFLDYMVFGWSKALDERGISASRTIDKCGTYMWLLGRDDIDHVIRDNSLYNPYGVPALIKACEMLGIEVPEDVIKFSNCKC